MITVLTTTLNSAGTLPEALASVRELAERVPLEHLLIDAGSTDGTWELMRAYIEDAAWATGEQRVGLPLVPALNELLGAATGQQIITLHGDDRLIPEALEAALSRASEETVMCGDVLIRDRQGRSLGVRRCDASLLNRYMSVNHPAMLVPSKIYERVGVFDERSPSSFDYEWTWRAFRSGVHFECRPQVLAEMRLGGISTQRAGRAAREICAFKLRGGAVGSAIGGYSAFLGKRAADVVLPPSAASWLRRWKRRRFGSIDDYSAEA